jgi:hypothetical protein
LISALVVSVQLHALVALALGKEALTHWIRGWVVPITYLDKVERKEIFPLLEFEL